MPVRPIVVAAAILIGATAAWHFAGLGLTLSHYDARGHLTVARRVTDNLTPGWRQLGALWLPLPHLLNAIPVRWMWNYQTGFSAVVINLVAMALGLGALARLVARHTGSASAAFAAAAVVLLNPAVLYLASTPMTEPLLFALCWLALDAVDRTLDGPEGLATHPAAGPLLALAVLTRYEAWPVAAALVVIAAFARAGHDRMRLFLRLAAWPSAAAGAFLLLGRFALGRWFADAGFFTPDNPAADHPMIAITQILRGYRDLAGPAIVLLATIGVGVCARRAIATRSPRPLLPLALVAASAVPLAAFLDGHPFRIRYMVPLVAASGALIGMAIGALPRRWRPALAAVTIALALWSRPPFSLHAPMLLEAQRERPAQLGRATVTAELAASYDGTPILASMSALGHYMQETSHIGLQIHDFLNEGNGDLWQAALLAPQHHVGWVLIEETAEGGDQLAALSRSNPHFLDGFAKVASGGGAVLYQRQGQRAEGKGQRQR